jgi:ubiquinone/menaquinone biosynthesis C-methylase UbiE
MIEKIFRKYNPEYKHRWEVYNTILKDSISKDTVWLDIGCGKNEHVAELGKNAKNAMGIDILDDNNRVDAPFLQSDLRNISLPSGYANLITLRMVVEHLEKVPEDFFEISRLLMPGGKLIILTTNSLSPIIFLPRILPHRLKSWIIQNIFSVDSRDIFPTYHKFNTPHKMRKGFPEMSLQKIEYLEIVPIDKPIMALIFGFWYTITKFSVLKHYRSNLLSVFQKIPE